MIEDRSIGNLMQDLSKALHTTGSIYDRNTPRC